jgi:hypothetical protein
MKLPQNTAAYLWGAFGGAVAIGVLGFTWFGWVTGGAAARHAAAAAQDAKVAALAPICAERFQRQADASAQIASLSGTSSWERGSLVEKSGFATMPGGKGPDSDVARACVEILLAKPSAAKG